MGFKKLIVTDIFWFLALTKLNFSVFAWQYMENYVISNQYCLFLRLIKVAKDEFLNTACLQTFSKQTCYIMSESFFTLIYLPHHVHHNPMGHKIHKFNKCWGPISLENHIHFVSFKVYFPLIDFGFFIFTGLIFFCFHIQIYWFFDENFHFRFLILSLIRKNMICSHLSLISVMEK